ncbi:MAG: heavy metal translocating P-type ATPase metal-binding domain-containing protein [Flavobacteriaceae bacterium]|nr:heavy metal translocating P-type ATPase metal-binding domain-containing protein [Flavobacteriaceae bacterium]
MDVCYHCGNDCEDKSLKIEQKYFCCNGCKTVFEILNQSELNCYYDFEKTPGSIPNDIKEKYGYLDHQEIIEKLTSFSDETTEVVQLYIPTIHCSSCIWILENLHKLNDGIVTSTVNFPDKTVRFTYKNQEISLRKVVELMSSIGYEPYISLDDTEGAKNKVDKTLIYQVTVAAFVFGNVMLLSFPEYFEVDEYWLNQYKYVFRGLMLVMSIPVVFFSARDYFISAYKGISHRILNIDIPIALGIAVLFVRSVVEVLFDIGGGFFDSLTGLVFFLLLGKFFQKKTYNYLSFERDYKSYFPIAVTKICENGEESIPLQNIKKRDRLLIRNEELIPVDCILISGNASIDYSFVTGEAVPVEKESGAKLFAGGKQTAGAIEIEVVETIEQSYLTQLWGNDVFAKKSTKSIKNLTDSISKYFTMAILTIATVAGIYWSFIDVGIAVNVVTAVLIIACPCALALSAPFALGNILRIFGLRKFYVKNADTVEHLAKIDTIVFDKTGTLTSTSNSEISYTGTALTKEEQVILKSLLRMSNHPLSRALYAYLPVAYKKLEVQDFEEVLGKGVAATVGEMSVKFGAASFVGANKGSTNSTVIYVRLNEQVKGYYELKNQYREKVSQVFSALAPNYKLVVLSGDNDGERAYLEEILPKNTELVFHQKPEDKLDFIKNLQESKCVLMVGDGLNDAGALMQSNVGISISENINVFSPACDIIMDAKLFRKLPDFMRYAKKTVLIIKMSFGLSFMYNLVGMYFALTGMLTPVVAAILMPLSSITIVIFVTLCTNLLTKK